MAFRIDKLPNGTKKVITKAVEEPKIVQSISRELQMVPKYLECAKAKAGDLYRFNTKQIDDITSACKKYKTNLSITDVVKDLLEIGNKEGNCKQLTSDEMIGFLKATSGMKIHEQKNVIRFLKVAQEDMPAKITPEYIRKTHPYEWYRNASIKLEESNPKAYNSDYVKEEFIKTRYENFIAREYELLSNPYYSARLYTQKYPFVKYISENNREVVSKIAGCNNPDAMYGVLRLTGVTPSILEASSDLVKIYEMSKGNMFLIRDVSRSYFPDEIKDITNVLRNESPQNKRALETYYQISTSGLSGLEWSRPNILEMLGIKDKVNLKKLQYQKVDDVYPAGNMRGRNISGGNFERGKKK